jgi:very-short-patch-repair endonuclease
MTGGGYNRRHIAQARELRRAMPPAERKLWHEGLRLLPQHFRRQRPFGPHIVDFYCASAKLVIELDGDSHDDAQAQHGDQRRDAYLVGLGLRVLRFTNAQVMGEFEGVMVAIAEAALTPPSPAVTPPLLRRGGTTALPPLLAGEVAAQPPEG